MVGKALIKLLHENSNAVHSNEKVLNSMDSVYMHFDGGGKFSNCCFIQHVVYSL